MVLWLECGHEGEVRLRKFELRAGRLVLVSAWCHTCKEYRNIVDIGKEVYE